MNPDRQSAESGSWDMARVRPHPRLQPYIRSYFGGVDEAPALLVRRELPGDLAPVIFNFGPAYRLIDPVDPRRSTDLHSFAAGAYDHYVQVAALGRYPVIQVDFTLLGLRLLRGRPLAEWFNRVVPIDEVLGPGASRLAEALYDAPDWTTRFAILDREFAARLDAAQPLPAWLGHVRARIVRSGGQVSMRALVEEVGFSHKHVVARFSEEFGLTPKMFARVLRFDRAAQRLARSERCRFADIALACGYYDQAHFTRDFREFAGVSPTVLLASRLPDQNGFA